ncbi:MAG: transcription antitermination factor NusB [Gammaproteobacteria bacterium]
MSKARSRARRLAMQGLYEWQVSGNAPQEILQGYRQKPELESADVEYFQLLLLDVPEHLAELDKLLTPLLSRPLQEVDPVELAILRLAAYELVHRLDVPYRVVINEAVELAKVFGAEAGHKFVNGILDKLAATVRSAEVNRKKSSKR